MSVPRAHSPSASTTRTRRCHTPSRRVTTGHHHLPEAVQKAGSTEPDQVMGALKSLPIDDMFAKGYIRADGAMVHGHVLMQVEKAGRIDQALGYYRWSAPSRATRPMHRPRKVPARYSSLRPEARLALSD
ncbi:ABC transporter substrate-binding protein [Comamonas sp. JC664]|uniref:ABC transporter substrate-binding protein n=1 Tax=Comamonas sp. JC664 TaxID=2801917 RepID=UPI00361831C7